MKKEFYTVEETAQILNLHVKTVRRFLREGRIGGRKIGRAWMIPVEDLKEYAHGEISERETREFSRDSLKESISVSAVVEFHERRAGEASRLSNSLMAMLNCKDPSWGTARYDFIYHPEEGKARYVLYGSPAFLAEIMKIFEIIMSQGEE